jgi:hypothetical protein
MSRADVAYWTCAAAACVCAILPFIPQRFTGYVAPVIVIFVYPALWLACFSASAHFATSVGRGTRWIALTAPFAFFYIAKGVVMLFIMMLTGVIYGLAP